MSDDEDDGVRTPVWPPPSAPWEDAFPAEYRAQPRLPQTPEAFAQQKRLDARGRKRFYPKTSKNGASKCNAYNPDTQSWCDNRAADVALGAKKNLVRCSKCGAGRRHHGNCPAKMLLHGEHKSGAKQKRTARFMTTTVAVNCCNIDCARAVAKVIHKHDKEGVPYPAGFVRPRSVP